jgi:hypothetical protein
LEIPVVFSKIIHEAKHSFYEIDLKSDFEMRVQILTTSYGLHAELGKNI